MYTELLLGTLVACLAPQDRAAAPEAVVEPEIRTIEIEIPAIEIPALDLAIPELDLEIPLPPEVGYGGWYSQAGQDDQDTETDTTFEVSSKAVLGVRNHAGEIVIRTWDRNQVRVEASHSSHDRVKIFQSESSVKIKSETRHGLPDIVDYEITVPRSMPLDLWGFQTDVSVDGARNGVRVETMSGDIELRDVGGEISVRSVEGDIRAMRGKGSLEVHGVDGEVAITDFEGDLLVQSIDGDLRLEGISSGRVEAKTVDGDVFYTGSIRNDGRYRLTTHDGDVVVAVPGDVNATVSVATFDGGFEADFTVKLDRTEATRRFSFVLGDGSARLDLHSFDGDIQLVRR